MNWFNLLPLTWRLGIAAVGLVAVLGALGGTYAYIDHQGYARATAEWTLKYDAREVAINRERMDEAIRQAKVNSDAKAAEDAAIADYIQQRDAALALAAQLEKEAAADPNASVIGIDGAAVDRLNRIR